MRNLDDQGQYRCLRFEAQPGQMSDLDRPAKLWLNLKRFLGCNLII